MTFNDQIKKKRKEKSMTQAELAEKVGVSHATIARYETGKIPLTVEMMQKIASELDIDISELMYKDRQERVHNAKELLTENIIAEIVSWSEHQDMQFIYGYGKDRTEWLFMIDDELCVSIPSEVMYDFWDRIIKHASIELNQMIFSYPIFKAHEEERDGKTVLIKEFLNNGKQTEHNDQK